MLPQLATRLVIRAITLINLQCNNVARQDVRRPLESGASYILSIKASRHGDVSFRCTYHAVSVSRSSTLSRVEIVNCVLTIILELKVVAFVAVVVVVVDAF